MIARRNPPFLRTVGAVFPTLVLSPVDAMQSAPLRQECEVTFAAETVPIQPDPVVLEFEFSQPFPPVSDVTVEGASGLELTLRDDGEPEVEIVTARARPGDWEVVFHVPSGEDGEAETCSGEINVSLLEQADEEEPGSPVAVPDPEPIRLPDPELEMDPVSEPSPSLEPSSMPDPEPLPEPGPLPESSSDPEMDESPVPIP